VEGVWGYFLTGDGEEGGEDARCGEGGQGCHTCTCLMPRLIWQSVILVSPDEDR
jgi:hypothetical protein